MFDWIQRLADWLVYEVLSLGKGQHLSEALYL